MSELVITAAGFVIQPLVNLPNGNIELRWWYSRSFLASDGTQVNWGTGRTGFRVTVPCQVAGGLVVVEQDSTLWTTDDARDPSPQSIFISAGLFTAQGKLIQQLTIANKAQWVVPVALAPSTEWQAFSIYNQAVSLANAPANFYTAAQVEARLDQSFDEHPASDLSLGTVLLSTPATQPAQPVVWGENDPLVRDAIKLQGVDVAASAPADTQVLIFNAAADRWQPGNQAAGTGNVISNEVTSVDGEGVVFSGTGGHTIRRFTDTGLVRATSGVLASSTVGTTDIDNTAVTFTKVQDIATDRLLGRDTASSGSVEELTVGGGVEFTGSTGIQTSAFTGDVTKAAGGTVQTIPNDTVTYAKMQNVSAVSRLLGRGDSGAPGDVQEIELGGGLSMTGTTLAASGSGGYDTVQDEGVPLTQRSTIDFQGAGVSAADSGGVTVVTIPGGGAAASFAGIAKFGAVGR